MKKEGINLDDNLERFKELLFKAHKCYLGNGLIDFRDMVNIKRKFYENN